MAEDEPVSVVCDDPLAQRLGEAPSVADGGHKPPHRRAHSASHQPSAVSGMAEGKMLADLIPFAQLLPPELAKCDAKEQQRLYKLLLDVGVQAFLHLESLYTKAALSERTDRGASGSSLLDPEYVSLIQEQMDALTSANASLVDDTIEAVRTLAPSSTRSPSISPVTPKMAAMALTIFASSSFRYRIVCTS